MRAVSFPHLGRVAALAGAVCLGGGPAAAEKTTYQCKFHLSCWQDARCETIADAAWGDVWISWSTTKTWAWVDYDTARYGVFMDQTEDDAKSGDVRYVGHDGRLAWFGQKNGSFHMTTIAVDGSAMMVTTWPDQENSLTEVGACRLEKGK